MNQEISAEEVFVGIAQDIRFLREVVTIALIVLVAAAVFAAVVYSQRKGVAGGVAGAAVKG